MFLPAAVYDQCVQLHCLALDGIANPGVGFKGKQKIILQLPVLTFASVLNLIWLCILGLHIFFAFLSTRFHNICMFPQLTILSYSCSTCQVRRRDSVQRKSKNYNFLNLKHTIVNFLFLRKCRFRNKQLNFLRASTIESSQLAIRY
jgi:hypothetical protein